MKLGINMHIQRIMDSLEVDLETANKIENAMAGMGFRFSQATDQEFDSTAFEVNSWIEAGLEVV